MKINRTTTDWKDTRTKVGNSGLKGKGGQSNKWRQLQFKNNYSGVWNLYTGQTGINYLSTIRYFISYQKSGSPHNTVVE